LREIVDADDGLHFAVLDFKRVTHADRAATRMLAGLVHLCAARGSHIVLTRVRRGELLAEFSSELDPKHARSVSFQPQLDLGLEWCERGLLERYAAARAHAAIAGLAGHRLCLGATAADMAHLEACVERCQFEPGSTIVRRGDASDALYFLVRGEVSVIVELPQGGFKRLSTLSAGMGFGESALIAGGVRSADVRADTAVECCTLSASAFARLEHDCPSLMIRLMQNLLHSTANIAARLTAEVAALEG
jgi:CRP-like cAMP-binding protein